MHNPTVLVSKIQNRSNKKFDRQPETSDEFDQIVVACKHSLIPSYSRYNAHFQVARLVNSLLPNKYRRE